MCLATATHNYKFLKITGISKAQVTTYAKLMISLVKTECEVRIKHRNTVLEGFKKKLCKENITMVLKVSVSNAVPERLMRSVYKEGITMVMDGGK